MSPNLEEPCSSRFVLLPPAVVIESPTWARRIASAYHVGDPRGRRHGVRQAD